MRHAFALVVPAAALVALVVTLVVWPITAPPRHTNVREIIADPHAFDGVTVHLSTAAFEDGPDRTLVYRRLANRPPLVVIDLAGPGGRRPPAVVGRVKIGDPIRVTDARPAPSQ